MASLTNPYDIIKSPLITEKASGLGALRKYVFWVNMRSNKIEIRRSIETLYKVKVTGVSIINMQGKKKRLRMRQAGLTSAWKKAIVTLRIGDQIKIT